MIPISTATLLLLLTLQHIASFTPSSIFPSLPNNRFQTSIKSQTSSALPEDAQVNSKPPPQGKPYTSITLGLLSDAHFNPHEKRVALTPTTTASLVADGFKVLIESGAGRESFTDLEYEQAGAKVEGGWEEVMEGAEIVVKIRAPGE